MKSGAMEPVGRAANFLGYWKLLVIRCSSLSSTPTFIRCVSLAPLLLDSQPRQEQVGLFGHPALVGFARVPDHQCAVVVERQEVGIRIVPAPFRLHVHLVVKRLGRRVECEEAGA